MIGNFTFYRRNFNSSIAHPQNAVLQIFLLIHYKSPTALLDMHHLTCGVSSLLHSVNLILFTLLLVHLSASNHQFTVPTYLRSHHLWSIAPRLFTPD